jgi:precorrin-6A/cobalt-precorrin-6A reductase
VRVLILGGISDAVRLAEQATSMPNLVVITSLAGRTQHPTVPEGVLEGAVRVGGFGGVSGLVDYLQAQCIDRLIDATHPFAAQISWNAAAAAHETGIPFLRLVRPAWPKVEGDHWLEVESVAAAVMAIPSTAKRVFLTIGRQQIAPFAPLTHLWFLLRSIDPPSANLPLPQGQLLLERGPFSLKHERDLLLTHRIDTIVSKNSGGDATYAKVIAARELGLPIVMIQRPEMPPATQIETVEAAIAWLQAFP